MYICLKSCIFLNDDCSISSIEQFRDKQIRQAVCPLYGSKCEYDECVVLDV